MVYCVADRQRSPGGLRLPVDERNSDERCNDCSESGNQCLGQTPPASTIIGRSHAVAIYLVANACNGHQIEVMKLWIRADAAPRAYGFTRSGVIWKTVIASPRRSSPEA